MFGRCTAFAGAAPNPVAVESAHGALVTEVDGTTFIDPAGGIGMEATAAVDVDTPQAGVITIRAGVAAGFAT